MGFMTAYIPRPNGSNSTQYDTACKRCGARRGEHAELYDANGRFVRGVPGGLARTGCTGYVRPSSSKKV